MVGRTGDSCISNINGDPAAQDGNGVITTAVLEAYLTTPADIGIDHGRRLLMPSLSGHSAMTIPLNGRERL
jgi:hypothetical protein